MSMLQSFFKLLDRTYIVPPILLVAVYLLIVYIYALSLLFIFKNFYFNLFIYADQGS